VMKATFKLLMGSEYVSHINNLSASLHQQQTLITHMQSTCPKNTTHWVVMGSLTSWFLQKTYSFEWVFCWKERTSSQAC
jgi:hypothetical protein